MSNKENTPTLAEEKSDKNYKEIKVQSLDSEIKPHSKEEGLDTGRNATENEGLKK